MENMDEMDYVKRILDGDTKLFSVFLERHQRQVHSLIRQIIPCREDAEELTQDVFLKAFRNLDSFRGDCSISTWMHRIAYNTAISATRKMKISYPVFDEYLLNNIPDDSVDRLLDCDEDEELMQKLEKAIGLLEPQEQALISLYYNHSKPVNEISVILQISPDNVKVRLHRARKKIVLMINENKI